VACRPQRPGTSSEGYGTCRPAAGRAGTIGFPTMIPLAISAALQYDIGLLVTFLGIGLLVNGLIIYIFILIRGEHHQNLEYRSRGRAPRQ
jgi:hypothetical protein